MAQAAPTGYVIRGGREGKRRLELLGRVLWPRTFALLKRTGIREGMHCLDLGCGGGDVTRGIARLVGPGGRVLGVDMDPVKLAQAREEAARQGLTHIEFRQANVYECFFDSAFDRVYARFLLTHLPDCPAVLAAMRRALRPGGIVIVEDIDFTGSFCYPPCPAYDRYVALYRDVVRLRKGDADVGPKLYSLLIQAGLQCVHLDLYQPLHVDQEGKAISLSTLENIADALVGEGLADTAELRRVILELERFTEDPTTIVAVPRIFQAWGQRV